MSRDKTRIRSIVKSMKDLNYPPNLIFFKVDSIKRFKPHVWNKKKKFMEELRKSIKEECE
ncbi:hypothetical protein [Streptococcus parauberis]|uniref:hypothetical protein n=1 Tax=Streptococcus parauberis TaxID=1348 RepID=UPI000789B6A4|nr:hypothetical protein [Streptococcus parauberis]KYP17739.1 hypothetical protein TN39_01950 [Streptococcus parauberis]KYP18606.1 hypothetical protein AKL14_00892 [Streptococcus parauberis]KYP20009.1 hypothetical protein AKL13_00809 [Streptococcus parauberis]KYP27340.1 hypothetical protein TM50_00646 [Streptococcus parauberis]KYP27606.1 hypothetical protein TP84_00475 [Streptococcus parauberis]